MDGPPIPALPRVRIVMDARHTDRIGKTEQRGKVVTDIPPGMMRAVRECDRARTVFPLLPFNLVGDELNRLGPGDSHISRLAAVLRIAFAIRIEIDALHRIEQAIWGIDNGFRVLPVRRQRGFAWRPEFLPARFNGP